MAEPTLRLSADLRASVVTPEGGAAQGTISADGAVLTVHTDRPAVMWDAAVGTPSIGPRSLGPPASFLADQGLTVQVTGPGGPIVTIGAEASSPFGRLVTGSEHVRFGDLSVLRPVLQERVVSLVRTGRAGTSARALPARLVRLLGRALTVRGIEI